MKLLPYIFSVLACLLAGHSAQGQYNDSIHYHVAFASSGSINNTDNGSAYLTTQGLKLGVKRKDISLNSTTGWVYGEQDRKLTNNDFNSSLDFDLYRTLPHFYYWGLANFMSGYSLRINEQYQGGAGAAYNVVDRKACTINVSYGILYEKSDILLGDTVRDIYSTFRNSLRLSLKWKITNIASIDGTGFYQPSLNSGSDYIIRVNTGVDIKLRKWLAVTAAYTYNRFNRTLKENSLFTYGLTIEDYF